MTYTLSVDYGTSFTAAALSSEARVELLEVEDDRRFPSGVLLAEDGSLLVGRVAFNQARRLPERFERTPKRLVGQPAVLLGGEAVEVVDLVGAVLRQVFEAARQRQGGSEPERVVLTHPAGWGPERQAVLRQAANQAGLGEPQLVSEPEAAAWFFVEDRRGGEPVVEEGQAVAIYDLGGGTFDTAVLRRTGGGFELAGAPGGLDWFGGEAFDEQLFDLVLKGVYERDPAVWKQLKKPESPVSRRARLQLREDVRQAKESLSGLPRVSVAVSAGNELLDVELTQGEFEGLIRPDLERTVSILEKTVRDAGVDHDDLAAVYLTGGSSRIPLVAAGASQFHEHTYTRPDPKTLVAVGALAAKATREPPPPPPPPPPPSPPPSDSSVLPPDQPVSPPPRFAPQHRRAAVSGAIGILLAALVAGAAVTLFRGGNDEGDDGARGKRQPAKDGSDSVATDIKRAGAKVVGELQLQPVEKSRGAGVAVITARGKRRDLIVQARVTPNTKGEAYEVWLYNSDRDARSLGAQTTDREGSFEGAVQLPSDFARFKFVDISRESVDENESHSGASVLRGRTPGFVTPP